jgi:putative CocE/NonD family hydrolase
MPTFSDYRGSASRPDTPAHVRWGVRIPMRDGVTLNAMVFIPRDSRGRAPVVFEMTPYGIDAFYGSALEFASHGITFALIDSRGRGDSEGEFEMFEVDINDTVDAIEWLSRQSWCDGQVAMYGGSYSGANQWTAAKAGHRALKTITPWGAGCPGIDVSAGGVPFVGHLSWHLLTSGRDTYWGMGADSGYWAEMLAQIYRENRPAAELPEMAGIQRPKFLQSLRDPYYALRAMTFLPTDDEIRRIDMPILSSTGHYDSTHPGTLYHFRRFEQLASEAARRKHYLVIGPWHHAGMDGTDRVGDLQFGPEAKVDMAEVRRQWFRWSFGLGDKPAFLQHRIMYYMAGAEEWRGCDTLDEAFSTTTSLYFRSADGSAGDLFHSGQLCTEPVDTPADTYIADPFDTEIIEMELRKRSIARPSKDNTAIQYPEPLRGLQWQLAGEDPTDSAFAYNLRGQGVVYHSAPLVDDLEIAGTPQLQLWLTLDAPDTDVVALLYEILPDDGSSILLWSDILRLRYRNGWRKPELATPGVPFEFTFGMPKFMSRRIGRGSRLRLIVRSPASINYQKNLHSGKPPSDELPGDARRCTVMLHHEPGRQSVLRLPVSQLTTSGGHEDR